MVERMGGVRGHRWTPPQLSLEVLEVLELAQLIEEVGHVEDLALAILDLIPEAGVEVHQVVSWLTPLL